MRTWNEKFPAEFQLVFAYYSSFFNQSAGCHVHSETSKFQQVEIIKFVNLQMAGVIHITLNPSDVTESTNCVSWHSLHERVTGLEPVHRNGLTLSAVYQGMIWQEDNIRRISRDWG